jgi:hypothetical protein
VAVTDPAGFKTFADDVVLTASEINGYLMQGILVFADAAARDTALSGSLAEGRFCFLKSDNTTYVYDGATWQAVTGGSAAPTVSGTTGSPSTGTGKAGRAMYTWTSNGSITFSVAGTIRVLIVAGGRGGSGGTTNSGGGGEVVDLLEFYVEAATYDVTVGAGGTYPSGTGGNSSVVRRNINLGAVGSSSANTGNNNYSANSVGVLTDISGSSVGYGGAGESDTNAGNYSATYGGADAGVALARANSGGGGNEYGAGTGAAGKVIVLV